MKLSKSERARAVETLSHLVAGAVHVVMSRRRITVAELKGLLFSIDEAHGECVWLDNLLEAKHPHSIRLTELADVAYALDFQWDFALIRIADEPMTAPTESKPDTGA